MQNKEVRGSGRACKIGGIDNKNKNVSSIRKLAKLKKLNLDK